MDELSALTNMQVMSQAMHSLYSNSNVSQVELYWANVDASDEDSHTVESGVSFVVDGKKAFLEVETVVKHDEYDKSDETVVSLFGKGVKEVFYDTFAYLPEYNDKDEKLSSLLNVLKSL